MDASQSPNPPAATSILFARGVVSRLDIWPVLRLAVQDNWGGPHSAEKRTWLASEIVDAFEEQQDPAPDDQYVEEMLLQIMSDEFGVVVEDGSADVLARDVVRLWEETRVGKADLVLKFEEMVEKMKGKKVAGQIRDDVVEEEEDWEDDEDGDEDVDGEDDDDMDVEEEVPQLVERRPKSQPEVDEDGFTLVKGKGKAHR